MKRKAIAAIVVTFVVSGQGVAWAQDDPAAIRKALERTSSREATSLLGGSRAVAPNRIVRISRRDSPRNGALVGALIGGGVGLVGAVLLGRTCANEGGTCAGAGLGLIALGAGVGASVGFLGDTLTHRDISPTAATSRGFPPGPRHRSPSNRGASAPPIGVRIRATW